MANRGAGARSYEAFPTAIDSPGADDNLTL